MSRLMHVKPGPHTPPTARRELAATSADGSRLHIEVHGVEEAPTVVLAHGWTCSTAFWAPLVRRLADGHRVVLYDQRGHGRSPAPGPGGYSAPALADDLEAVLRAVLAPGERAVLAGHSMGSMTIMAAADRPALRDHAAAVLLCNIGTSRLLAEATVLAFGGARVRLWVHRALLTSRAPLGPVTPVTKRILKYATMGPGAAPDTVEAFARLAHACPRAVRAAWGEVMAELDIDHQIQQLTVPTAVIAGAVDRLTPLVHPRRVAAELPHCVGLTELPGLGHMTPVEAPDAVAGAIRDLVRDHLAPAPAPIPVQRQHPDRQLEGEAP